MNDEILGKLQTERTVGNRARVAWDNFLEAFISAKKDQLFDAFQSVSIMEQDDLMEIKRQLMVLQALEVEIQTVIQTGQMASKMINEETEH